MGYPGSASSPPKPTRSLPYRIAAWLKPLLPAIIASVLLSLLYFLMLQQQYEQYRHKLQQQQQQMLMLGFEQITADIRRITAAVSQQVINSALPSALTSQHGTVEQSWQQLMQIQQPAAVALYALDGTVLAQWPESNLERRQQKFNRFWIERLNQAGTAQQVIFCQSGDCAQYRFAYLPTAQHDNIILSVAKSISPLLKPLQSQHSKTGLLTAALDPQASTDLLVFKWGYRLNTAQPEPLLQQALETLAQSEHALPQGKTMQPIEMAQRHFELASFPLLASNQSLLIKLEDATEQISAMRMHALQMAVLILLLSGSATLFYLKRLKSNEAKHARLAEQHNAMPVEAAIEYTGQHASETAAAKAALIDNEPDIPSLSQKIEQLQQHNDDINLELKRHKHLLSQQRECSNKLLDCSQAFILTLQQDGTIKSINIYAEKITGFSPGELQGKNFIDLYSSRNPNSGKDLDAISAVATGMKADYQHQTRIMRKDGEECIIQWSHSRHGCQQDSTPLLLSIGQDVTTQHELENKLRWLVNHDSLTTLFNRRRFEKEMDAALQWAKQSKGDGILITIDLENFKDINDSCGHKVGDIILRKVANSLQTLLQPIDRSAHKVAARLGGDEFAIILRHIDHTGGCDLSQRIIKALNHISHFQHQISFKLSASIGIATFSDASHNTTELLSNANYARNQAKVDGRNRYQLFNPENSHLKQTHHRMIWRDRIENALRNNRFVLHFQPILNISQNRISHYETLIRMLDENNKLVAPGLFIHIAEQYGLIQRIDNYIIASAIAKQGELANQGHDLTLTINLSAKAFDDERLYHKISQAIRENNANPQHLVFEITETGAVSNIDAAQKIMTQIQALGCKFALDDFGVGFSSFRYLRELPVDLVKIDGSFVSELAKNDDNKVLVKALSEVATGFNKLTVAEFVDSKQTLDILQRSRVNYAQGFYIGKPSATIPVALLPELAAAPSLRLH